ncbi:MAG: diaminopimelate epimerase [Burkholderiales bacterium]
MSTRLKFSKMQGLGNDFVMFDAINQRVELSPDQLRHIADRRFGIGCDQILLVEKPSAPDVDFRYRIFNPDGGEVEHCGNGARCFVKFVRDKGLTDKTEIRVETRNGIIIPKLENNGDVTVDMGAPVFEPVKIPFKTGARAITYNLFINGQAREFSVLSMGNPHAVQIVADVEAAPVLTEGPQIENHSAFPARVNAGFMQIVDRHRMKLRVFERGAGETLACGTGACAAVVAGITRKQLDSPVLVSPVQVSMRGGELSIAWGGEGLPVFMTGSATHVYDGEIPL